MKTIFITGANSEIATEYIKKQGQDYDRIIMHYWHRRDRIDEVKDVYGDKIIPVEADFSKRDEVAKLIEELRGYEIDDFLHMPAPKLRHMRFARTSIEEFELEMQVVFWSFLMISQSFIPGMIKRKKGHILAVLTEYTITEQPTFLSHYISVQYTLLGLIKSLASEYGSKGLIINGISPGMIETDFISELSQYVVNNNAKLNARGKNLSSADLIPSIKYLLSETEGINGQNILIR